MNQITSDVPALRLLYWVIAATSLLTCSAGASAQDESGEDSDEMSKPIILKLDYRSNKCAARMEIEYFQRGENARVNASLSNADCAASAGEYTIEARIRDEDGENRKLEFHETWSRDDNATIESTRDYFIGDNVDLVRVNSRNLKCRCAETASEESPETQEQ